MPAQRHSLIGMSNLFFHHSLYLIDDSMKGNCFVELKIISGAIDLYLHSFC